jgi:hypothetical protein
MSLGNYWGKNPHLIRINTVYKYSTMDLKGLQYRFQKKEKAAKNLWRLRKKSIARVR